MRDTIRLGLGEFLRNKIKVRVIAAFGIETEKSEIIRVGLEVRVKVRVRVRLRAMADST